jgi:hypothetical protein
MALAVTEDQVALAQSVAGWAERAQLRPLARQQTDVPALQRTAARPAWWPGAVELGLMGLALPEDVGGSAATVAELAVVVEELGRHVAHGPFVSSAAFGLALAVARRSATDTSTIDRLLTLLAEGEAAGAIALEAAVTATRGPEGLELSGDAGLVSGVPGANWLLVPATDDGKEIWTIVDVGGGVREDPVDNLDVTRRLGRVTLEAAIVPADHVLSGLDAGLVRDLHVTVAAAEAAGIARWSQETATAYAKVREQFGRAIGSFQSIKHLCSDMLARSELAAAAAWDAAVAAADVVEGEASDGDRRQLELAAATAGAVALQNAVANAKDCIQIHGGIGFTWEHDAHLYFKRAKSSELMLGDPSYHRELLAQRIGI